VIIKIILSFAFYTKYKPNYRYLSSFF